MKGCPGFAEGEGGRPLARQGRRRWYRVDSISQRPAECSDCVVSRRRAEDGGGVCEEALLRGREGDGSRSRGERGASSVGVRDEGRKDSERVGALSGPVRTLRGEGSSDARDPTFFPAFGPFLGSSVPSGQTSNVAAEARPRSPASALPICCPSFRAAALAFRFPQTRHTLSRLRLFAHAVPSATSFYSFRLADSHSSFGSWHQRHFLCEALFSRPPSRNPPVGGSHRSLFLSFMPLGGGGGGLTCY